MNTFFTGSRYTLKKQKIAISGVFRLFDEANQLAAYSKQKALKLKEEFHVYADEKQTQEILSIRARGVLDFSATYDVVDHASGQKIGALRRKGLKSMARDQWEVLDGADQVIGGLQEDSAMKAFLRRAFLGSFLPQRYDLTYLEQPAGHFAQKFGMGYTMELHLAETSALDHRLAVAAALLLAAIEGKQN